MAGIAVDPDNAHTPFKKVRLLINISLLSMSLSRELSLHEPAVNYSMNYHIIVRSSVITYKVKEF
jgi:hypothetical protein